MKKEESEKHFYMDEEEGAFAFSSVVRSQREDGPRKLCPLFFPAPPKRLGTRTLKVEESDQTVKITNEIRALNEVISEEPKRGC